MYCVLQLNWFLFIFSLSRISPSSPNSPLSLCVFWMYKKTEIYDIYPFKYCFNKFLVSFTVDYIIYTHFLMDKPYSHFLVDYSIYTHFLVVKPYSHFLVDYTIYTHFLVVKPYSHFFVDYIIKSFLSGLHFTPFSHFLVDYTTPYSWIHHIVIS